jgi:hypothetical protein
MHHCNYGHIIEHSEGDAAECQRIEEGLFSWELACLECEKTDDDVLQFGELPPGVCPACMGLLPGIAIDGETIMHCTVCGDSGKVTDEQAEQYRQAVEEREKERSRE